MGRPCRQLIDQATRRPPLPHFGSYKLLWHGGDDDSRPSPIPFFPQVLLYYDYLGWQAPFSRIYQQTELRPLIGS